MVQAGYTYLIYSCNGTLFIHAQTILLPEGTFPVQIGLARG